MEQDVARPDGGKRVITYDDAVRAGVGLFLRTSTVDLEALAARLSVSRATLYRVIAGRDQLLGDVLWRQAEVLIDQARGAASSSLGGAERVLAVLRDFGRRLMASEPFREFLAQEPDSALRVLWTPAGGVHQRFVAVNCDLLREAVAGGELHLATPLHDLAYMLARIFESMWYADLMGDRCPSPDVAELSARALLEAG